MYIMGIICQDHQEAPARWILSQLKNVVWGVLLPVIWKKFGTLSTVHFAFPPQAVLSDSMQMRDGCTCRGKERKGLGGLLNTQCGILSVLPGDLGIRPWPRRKWTVINNSKFQAAGPLFLQVGEGNHLIWLTKNLKRALLGGMLGKLTSMSFSAGFSWLLCLSRGFAPA